MDLKQYLRLKAECMNLEKRIQREEKRLAKAPVYRVKVISSMRSDPYIQTHELVDQEPDSWELTKLKAKYQFAYEDKCKARYEVESFIMDQPDSRTRQILQSVYIDGAKQKDLCREWDISPGQISNILKPYK